jgi:hypothetical protein
MTCLLIAFTHIGPFTSLIPVETSGGSRPRYSPARARCCSRGSASWSENSASNVAVILLMIEMASCLPMHWRPPAPKCISSLLRSSLSLLSQRAGSNMLWSVPKVSGLWWKAWLHTATSVCRRCTRQHGAKVQYSKTFHKQYVRLWLSTCRSAKSRCPQFFV